MEVQTMNRSFEIGGITVTSHVAKEELNAFVSQLPPEKRADLTDILLALHEAGLITIEDTPVH